MIRATDSLKLCCAINEMPTMIARLTTPIGRASIKSEDATATELNVSNEILIEDSNVVIQHHKQIAAEISIALELITELKKITPGVTAAKMTIIDLRLDEILTQPRASKNAHTAALNSRPIRTERSVAPTSEPNPLAKYPTGGYRPMSVLGCSTGVSVSSGSEHAGVSGLPTKHHGTNWATPNCWGMST
jgi:hypothetical protein